MRPKDKDELIQIIKDYIEETNPKDGETINLNWIDTSKITDMSKLFDGIGWRLRKDDHKESFNLNLLNWDVSKVENMSGMFDGCEKF